MKTKYIILIIVLILIIALILLYFFKFRNKEEEREEVVIKDVISFSLSYSKGYAMNSNIRYELDFYQHKYVAKIKPYEVPEEEKKEIVVNKSKMEELENILKKHHVGKWDGFDKVDKDVLDGDDFSLSIRMEDKTTIHASGYMMWPDGYKDFVTEIDEFFMNMYNGE